MHKGIFLFVCLGFLCAGASAQPKLAADNIPQIVKAMTPEEKAGLVVGVDFARNPEMNWVLPGTGGVTCAIPRLGIPAIVMMDGPTGVRLDTKVRTSFPTGLLTSASWNRQSAYSIGEAIGEESLEVGNDVILAPGMNLLRNPLNGRNFEYFSEDPVLSGHIAAAYVNGVQSKGVGTSAKHFAANNQETNRLDGDSRLDTRTLRELYVKGFEIALLNSSPWTIMASYNYLNGEYTQESRGLLTDILRGDFGYKGMVVTDWTGKRNTPKQIHAGSDLFMGGSPSQTKHILESLDDGSLSMKDLDLAVTRVLELIVKTPSFKGNDAMSGEDHDAAHRKVAREVAGEGMVLLRNNGTLPMAPCRLSVFGVHSYDYIIGGNGAAWVNSEGNVSFDQGLENAGFGIDSELRQLYSSYAAYSRKDLEINHKVNVHVGRPTRPEPEITQSLIKECAKRSDAAVITLGRTSGEARDRILTEDFLLNENERNLLETVCETFQAQGKKVIVVLNICGPVETASWSYLPDAIICAWLPGEEGGNALADIVSGKVNPSGRLPMTFPLDYFDTPGAEDFPYDFRSNRANESVVHPERRGIALKNVAYTDYTEGIYVGYRHFCTMGKPVAYPFGYGLSYTTFEYSAPTVKVKGDAITATVTVTNTGSVAGKEAVGLYIAAPLGSFADKPSVELREFGKTGLLQPGQSETLTFSVPLRQLASFNSSKSRWETARGNYTAYFGADATSPKAETKFKVGSARNYPVSRACEPAGKDFTVLTYNVGALSKFSGDSSDDVTAVIKACDASIVGLNELDSCNRRHNVFQLKELASKLGGWNYHFASAFPFAEGAYGNGILSREPILHTWSITLPQMSGYEQRSVAVIETKDCIFASTHLDVGNEDARVAQATIINEWFTKHFSACRKPVFLAGDMNAAPDSPAIAELSKSWQLLSRTERSYPSTSPKKCIDYVFELKSAAHINCIDSGTIQTATTRTASDHLPVFAKLR